MGADVTTTTLPTTNGNHAQAEASKTDQGIITLLGRTQRIAALRAKGWKVELSGGRWAILTDPELLPERKARAIKVAMVRSTPMAPTTNTGTIGMDADAVIDSGYILVAAFLSGWSLGELPTVTNFDALLDLPARDYSALQSACEDLKDEAFTDYSPSTPAALADPSTPFAAGSA